MTFDSSYLMLRFSMSSFKLTMHNWTSFFLFLISLISFVMSFLCSALLLETVCSFFSSKYWTYQEWARFGLEMHWFIIEVSRMFSTKNSLCTLRPRPTAHWLWEKGKTMIHISLNDSKCFCSFKYANMNLSREPLTKSNYVNSSLMMDTIDFVKSSNSSLANSTALVKIRSARCDFWQSEPNRVWATFFSRAILTRDKLAAFLTTIYSNGHLSCNFSTFLTSIERHCFLNLCFSPSVTSFDHKVDWNSVPSFIR